MTAIEIAVCALGIAFILTEYSNLKRISQIERDLSERSIKPQEQAQEVTQEVPTQPQQAADDKQQQARNALRGAGVHDAKAYRGAGIAVAEGWGLLDIQDNIKMIRFMKATGGDVQKVNIYYGGKGGKRDLYTVATALNHPQKGKTQLFRKHITEDELQKILHNPRTHTDKGYYQNGGRA